MQHKQVVKNWNNGKSGKGYAMDTDGQNLYSWGKQIGRTLDDGTKQLLALIDVYTVSKSTRKHLTYAMRYSNSELVWPKIHLGYETDNDFMQAWNLLSWPENDSVNTLRYTKQEWKTFKGMHNAIKRINSATLLTGETRNGYTIYFKQYIGIDGHVVTADEFYSS